MKRKIIIVATAIALTVGGIVYANNKGCSGCCSANECGGACGKTECTCK